MNYDQLSFESILQNALSRIPEDIDKRPGSIIYDAIAPACYQLAEYYLNLRTFDLEINLNTASGEFLDRKAANYGITRIDASKAIKKGSFQNERGEPMDVPIGSRFSTISESESLVYEVLRPHMDEESRPVAGAYDLRCTLSGKNGNDYVGSLIMISFINNLASAELSEVVVAGRDVESDEELRQRCYEALTKKEFAGNVAAYKDFLKQLEGVGYVQIYPTWNGGGTVKCVLLDYEFSPVSSEVLQRVKGVVDPEGSSGQGVGIAPIGHQVTITTATRRVINISTTLQLSLGHTIHQLKDQLKQAVEDYFESVRSRWDNQTSLNEYKLTIYVAQVNKALLSVPGVDNAKNTKLNGVEADLELTESSILQEVPFLGEITYG